jgi:DNA-binding SARP family transcriptional activator
MPEWLTQSTGTTLRPPPALRLRLLRGFELTDGDQRLPVPLASRRLLAFLALHDRELSRSLVAGTLWPDTTEPKAAANLRTALWRVPQSDPPIVRATITHLALDPAVWVDVQAVVSLARALIDDRFVAAHEIDPAELAGELLPDFWDHWLVAEREKVRQLTVHALERLALRLLDSGDGPRAVLAALTAVEMDPLRESANRVLIQSHLAEGNSAEAIRQFVRFRSLLRDELGLEPTRALSGLVATVLDRRADLPAPEQRRAHSSGVAPP